MMTRTLMILSTLLIVSSAIDIAAADARICDVGEDPLKDDCRECPPGFMRGAMRKGCVKEFTLPCDKGTGPCALASPGGGRQRQPFCDGSGVNCICPKGSERYSEEEDDDGYDIRMSCKKCKEDESTFADGDDKCTKTDAKGKVLTVCTAERSCPRGYHHRPGPGYFEGDCPSIDESLCLLDVKPFCDGSGVNCICPKGSERYSEEEDDDFYAVRLSCKKCKRGFSTFADGDDKCTKTDAKGKVMEVCMWKRSCPTGYHRKPFGPRYGEFDCPSIGMTLCLRDVPPPCDKVLVRGNCVDIPANSIYMVGKFDSVPTYETIGGDYDFKKVKGKDIYYYRIKDLSRRDRNSWRSVDIDVIDNRLMSFKDTGNFKFKLKKLVNSRKGNLILRDSEGKKRRVYYAPKRTSKKTT